MLNETKELIRQLNSPADWAVVLGAGTAGLVLDGAINIVPIPFFSPGVCGLTAASSALAAKRGWEAARQSQRESRLVGALQKEARELLRMLELQGDRDSRKAASALRRAVLYKSDSSTELNAAIELAHESLDFDSR